MFILDHNSWTRNARKSKAQKTRTRAQFPKKLQRNTLAVGP